jgi:signal transduction histidine kinase
LTIVGPPICSQPDRDAVDRAVVTGGERMFDRHLSAVPVLPAVPASGGRVHRPIPPTLRSIAVVVSTMSVVLAIKLTFDRVLGGESPILFLSAVMVSAWLGGWKAGLGATVIATGLNHWFLTQSLHASLYSGSVTFARSITFAIEATLLCIMAGRLQYEARRAERAIRARDEFLAVASHELKNPLSALKAALAVATRTSAQASPDETLRGVRDRIAIAQRQVDRMVRLVNDLLQIGQVGAGTLRLERERADLSKLTSAAVSWVSEEARVAGCTLHLDAEAEVVGNWDPTRIEQVIMNLLSNAMKYGRGRPIDVTVDTVGTCGRVVVRDYGIGIRHEDQTAVFDRFSRSPHVKTARIEGAGIGLWVVREIIRQHGGDIRVDSGGPGEGSAFTLVLPLGPARACKKTPSPDCGS